MEQRNLVENFVESMSQLMELLQKETEILNSQIYEEIDPLQTRKVQLTKYYLDSQKNIQDMPDTLASLSDVERANLKILYKKFRNVLSENMLTLRGSYDATERVVNLVIDAVKKQRGGAKNTKAFGSRPQGYAAYTAAEGSSIALNTQT
ncbi:MAG: hypothetical protein HOD13_06500 [Rhodospirillaceae bacterium]|nr:hypothetical protein [Rhodospirillaceae bacterium]MBT5914477.1 hypothetical protein [Rhodospirillaceae bacterium]